MCKKNIQNLNIKRFELIKKGFLTKGEIQEFVPCGYNKACAIYNEIRNTVKKEGYENLADVVLAKRVLDILGMTAAEVRKNAEIEMKMLGGNQA